MEKTLLKFKDLSLGQYFRAPIDCYFSCVFCKIALTQAVIVSDSLFGECTDNQIKIDLQQPITETFSLTSPMNFPGYIFYSVKPGEKVKITTSNPIKRFIEKITIEYSVNKRGRPGWGK